MLGKIIKKSFVSTGLDNIIAGAAHRTGNSILRRLIPGPEYYKDQLKTIVRHGVKFRVQPSDFSQWNMFSDNNDLHIQAALKVLQPNSDGLILDVGTNIGHFSLLMAKMIEQKKWSNKIISFEPNPKIFARLKENLSLNPSLQKIIELKNIGIGDHDFELEISIPHRNSGAGSVLRNYDHEPHDTFLINIFPLDSLISSKVDFIKIDVEGFEYPVLQGAINTISKYHPGIYFETNREQPHQTEIFQFFKNLNYTFYREENGFAAFEPTPGILQSMEGVNNILVI